MAGTRTSPPTSVRRGSSTYSIVVLAAAFVGLGGFVAATAQPAATAPASAVNGTDPAARPAEITIHTDTGDHVFTVEWALDDPTRELGLMYRTRMDEDHGMVFDFFQEQQVAFWMHNTLIPLDMVFIDADGTVRSVAKNATPLSDLSIPSGGPVRYVLEINGGVADQISVDAGDHVDLQ